MKSKTKIWIDHSEHELVITAEKFNAEEFKCNDLFINPRGFKNGFQFIGKIKYNQTKNAGYWNVHVIKYDANKNYSEASSVEDINESDFLKTDQFCICPLV